MSDVYSIKWETASLERSWFLVDTEERRVYYWHDFGEPWFDAMVENGPEWQSAEQGFEYFFQSPTEAPPFSVWAKPVAICAECDEPIFFTLDFLCGSCRDA